MTSYDPGLIRLIKTIVNQSMAEAQRKTRIPGVLTGTVEDLDADLDVVYVRMDQEAMQSDPTQSDNYDAPGIIAVTRLGETFTDEQVRVTFDAATASANAMRTGIENKIVLPFGAEMGQRIILDGNEGAIGFFDDADQLVGFLDALQWFVGEPGGALARLDPIGGLRLWDQNDKLRVVIGAEEGLQVREGDSGITAVAVHHDGITVADPENGETISIASGTSATVPTPHWLSSTNTNPGNVHTTPVTSDFDTGDDIDIRFVCASAAAALGTTTYLPPTGFTEQADTSSSSTAVSLATSVATKDPADASPAAASFTNSSTSYTRMNGHSVIVRGGGTSSPAVRGIVVGATQTFASKTISMAISATSATTTGDLMLAHVAIAGGAIPVGWTVPEGWVQLGLQSSGVGTSHVLGSGIWIKPYSAGDPTTENIQINMTAAVSTKVQANVISISNPYRYPAGLDIRRGNRSMPRGLVKETVETDITTAWANGDLPQSVNLIQDAVLQAGRKYRIEFHCPAYEFAALGTTCRFEINVQRDAGGGFAAPSGGLVYHRQMSAAGTERGSIFGAFTYVPPTDETSDWRATIGNLVSGAGYTIQLRSGAGASQRSLSIFDVGAEY